MVGIYSDSLVFFVNGKKINEANPNPEWTLMYYLRNKLFLCGTKEACGEGGCGACTVMISRVNRDTGQILNLAVNACLTSLCTVHGAAIITVEGIGSIHKGLHPIQERLSKSHGIQCGFCSPGISMSTYTLLRNNPNPSEKDLIDALQGNLCRCTGYRPILEGLSTFCGSSNCCKNKKNSHNGTESIPLYDPSTFKPYDSSQDPIFPPELLIDMSEDTKSVRFTCESLTFFRPVTLEQLLNLKKTHPNALIIAGGTAKDLREKIRLNIDPTLTLIQISPLIPQLSKIEVHEDHLIVGAAVTFSQLENFCKNQGDDGQYGSIFNAFCNFFPKVGDLQLRNIATIGGGLVGKNDASDLTSFLVAAGASMSLSSHGSEESEIIQLKGEHFGESGGISFEPSQILTHIRIPLTKKNEYIWFTKRSNRKYGDIAIVNAASKITFQSDIIQAIRFVGNGKLFSKIVEVKESANFLISRTLSQDVIHNASIKILQEIASEIDDEAKCILSSIIQEFFIDISNWKQNRPRLEDTALCNTSTRKSSQLFQIVPKEQSLTDLIGRPVQHLSAMKSSTGELVFTDDTLPLVNELFGAVVLSKEASAKIVSVDTSEALALSGVVAFIDSKSLADEKNNIYGVDKKDERLFANDFVTSSGQIIGLVVAKDCLTARKGASLVKVTYNVDAAPPPTFTIEEAIAKKSFHAEFTLKHGDATVGFEKSERIFEGEIRTGGQKHVYMEPHSARAIPTEDGGVELLLTVQAVTDCQHLVAGVLGLPSNKVNVHCQRIGGGFGGRESRSSHLGAVVAVAAVKLHQPVRCTLTREEDMKFIGGRHPFLTRYKVGFNLDGRINSIKADIYSNGGCTIDASGYVLEAFLCCSSISYKIDNWDLNGNACFTNLQSNTAFRGFGGPQAIFVMDTIIQRVAQSVGKSAEEIREMHLYHEGDVTPLGMAWDNCTNQRCWDECKELANLEERVVKVNDFNSKNKFRKRGISMVTCSQGMGFPFPAMNQGGALVMIYKDGSVAVNHGGLEMGQGIHTKMVQIASRVLEIPIEKIQVPTTSTEKVPNTTVSAASMTCDLNGPAVLNACMKLKKRLEPIRKANPNGTWEEWISSAYLERINLSAIGFNKIEFPYKYNYITFGVGCTEVEINCVTGEHTVLRTDIVMDIGESLNPGVDIGQMEGGFMQGLGLFTLENTNYSNNGELTSNSLATYKIPTIANTPQEFNVSFLRGSTHPRPIYSAKALGEPPLYLGLSVQVAIQNAVKEFLKENNLNTDIFMDAPLTANDVRKACQVDLKN